jgi:hypothetical protein
MVISSWHRLIGALVLATAALSLGGCQKALSVGAVNRCGADVEVQADSVTESTVAWIRLRAGDRDGVVAVPQNAETLYVKVRAPGAGGARSFDAPMTSLEKPPAGVDYEAQLVLEGARCP